MYKLIFEIIEETQKAKSKADKIKVLKDNESWGLKDVLRGSYDSTVVWNLPEGKPPFTPNLPQSTPSDLQRKNTQFKYFVKGGAGDQMMKPKRERLFIELLESIHPKDADLVISMIAKKSIKGINRKLIDEAFKEFDDISGSKNW